VFSPVFQDGIQDKNPLFQDGIEDKNPLFQDGIQDKNRKYFLNIFSPEVRFVCANGKFLYVFYSLNKRTFLSVTFFWIKSIKG